MKNLTPCKSYIYILLFLGLLNHTSCNSKKENRVLKSSIDGVWELTNFYHLSNGDTLINSTEKVQHKIYLDGYVIWTVGHTPGAKEWHGYGTFSYKNDTLTEVLTSTSASMNSDHNKYIIPIEIGKNTYKQINTYVNNDTIYNNIEVYKKLN